MHFFSRVRSLASLPALFVSAVAAGSLPVPASDFPPSRSAASDSVAILESLQIGISMDISPQLLHMLTRCS